MSYLLDTCVISELVKKKPNPKVVTWIKSRNEQDLFISSLTIGEIIKGIEKLQDEKKRIRLQNWMETDLKERFQGRILDVDQTVATQWGKALARAEKQGKSMPAIDALIAATGNTWNCIVVTRNTSNMAPSGVELFNPWND